MPLSSLANLKAYLRIASSDTSQDTALTTILAAAEAVAKLFCKRTFDVAVITEYPRLLGQPRLILSQRPVRQYQLSTTFTAGSPAVTVTSTTGLVAGMPAVRRLYLPASTTISAVADATTLTLSQNALLSGTIVATYGLAIWLDAQGNYGQTDSSFADTSILAPGSDYALNVDSSDGSSKSALVLRLPGGTGGAGMNLSGAFDFWGGWGWGGYGGGYGRGGRLSARLAPVWPGISGCVKVTYAAGYDSTNLPAELTLACNMLAAAIRVAAPVGVPLDVTSITDQWVGLLGAPGRANVQDPPDFATVRQILRAYREASI